METDYKVIKNADSTIPKDLIIYCFVHVFHVFKLGRTLLDMLEDRSAVSSCFHDAMHYVAYCEAFITVIFMIIGLNYSNKVLRVKGFSPLLGVRG